MVKRCEWTGDWSDIDDIMVKYHDEEWGVPKHDDRRLFEDLVLDGAQAGLSWSTILNKRENYRAAFDNFDPAKVASYDETKIEELLQNPGIVRNRQKVNSAVKNAKAFLEIQEEFGSFDAYIWGFVDGAPIQNKWESMSELPAKTELSEEISKELKKRGFNFVGPTIIYAFMQAVGMVNDHTVDCFRYPEVGAMS
jgi:DNA-3-methyladenine glycosylase I